VLQADSNLKGNKCIVYPLGVNLVGVSRWKGSGNYSTRMEWINKFNTSSDCALLVRHTNMIQLPNVGYCSLYLCLRRLGLKFYGLHCMLTQLWGQGSYLEGLRKYAHFIALSHPYSTEDVTWVYMDNIIKQHGVPKSIMSGRDDIFYHLILASFILYVGCGYAPILNLSPSAR